MARNWDKEIAKAERALARNKANIMNAPTANGTAASWSNPKYDINKPIGDLDKLKEKDKKRQRKAVIHTIRKARIHDNLANQKPSPKYIERYKGNADLETLLKLDLPPVVKNNGRKRKRGQSKYKGRKPKGPFYTDPRTKEV